MEIRSGVDSHTVDGSYLTDAIRDFADTVASLQAASTASCTWDQEPNLAEWRFKRSGNRVELAIWSHDGLPNSPVLMFERTFAWPDFCRDVLEALLELKTTMGISEYENEWGYPFPEEACKKLEHAVSSFSWGNREQALEIARAVLTDQIGIRDASHLLLPILHSDASIASQEDFRLFQGIGSETDDLPIGKIRDEWHPDFLFEKDKEIARLAELWRDRVRSACERILLRAQSNH